MMRRFFKIHIMTDEFGFREIAPFHGISDERFDELLKIIDGYNPHECVIYRQWDKRDTYFTDKGILPHEVYFAGMVAGANHLDAGRKMNEVRAKIRSLGVVI